MNYLTHQILNSEELEILDQIWIKMKYLGRWYNAGKHAAELKNNLQLKDSNLSKEFSGLIIKRCSVMN